MVVFLMGQIEFLRDEIKIKNNITERLLTLKPVLHDNQLSSYNSQQIKKINKNFVDKNADTDDIPVDYQSLTQTNLDKMDKPPFNEMLIMLSINW